MVTRTLHAAAELGKPGDVCCQLLWRLWRLSLDFSHTTANTNKQDRSLDFVIFCSSNARQSPLNSNPIFAPHQTM